MGRAPCCDKEGLNKGPWTEAQDAILSAYIKEHGEGCWRTLPKAAGLARCGKSCRLRWVNYLRPDLKRGNISPDEDDLIITLHSLLGNRWSLIAGRIPGRTDNEIKNYWNTHLKRKLKSMGLDPSGKHKLPSFPFFSTAATSSSSLAPQENPSHDQEEPAQAEDDSCMEPEDDTTATDQHNHLSPPSLTSPVPLQEDIKEMIEEDDPALSSIMTQTRARIVATNSTSELFSNHSKAGLSFGNFSSEADDSDRSSQLIPDPGQATAARSRETTALKIVKAAGQAPYPSSPDSVLSTYKGLHNPGALMDHRSQTRSLLQVNPSNPAPLAPGPPGHIPQMVTVAAGTTSSEIARVGPADHEPDFRSEKPLGMGSECNTPSTCSTEATVCSLAERNYASACDSRMESVVCHSESSSLGLCRNYGSSCKDSSASGPYFSNYSSEESLATTTTTTTTAAKVDSAAAASDQDPYYTLMANLGSLKYTSSTDQLISSISSSGHCGYCPLENLFSPFPEYASDGDVLRHEMLQPLLGDQSWGGLQPSHSGMAFLANDDSLWEPCIM